MPKKPPKNAFFYYMLHFKNQEARRGRHYSGLSEIPAAASESWNKMNAQQRGPFEKQAKDEKYGASKEVEKFTSQGIPVSLIEKEQKQSENAHKTMLNTIKAMVQKGFTENVMGSQEFYFISGCYFMNLKGLYLPAEIAMVKFTFDNGIVSKFHTYVNPGNFVDSGEWKLYLRRRSMQTAGTIVCWFCWEKVPKGYLHEARENSASTHRLPIPPDSKGEKNYQLILDQIDKFLGNTRQLPPVFTAREDIPMIESFLRQFSDCRELDGVEDNGRYRVYPLHQLFYEIKEEAVKTSLHGESFRSIHIAETHLNRDHYAYLKDTACNYHEEIDCVNFCALSNVQKWAYIFADHICVDLNIELIPGQHLPSEVDISHLNQTDMSRSSKLNDTDTNRTYIAETESQSSRTSSVAAPNLVTPHWEARPKSEASSIDEDFPSLGSRNRKAGPSKKRSDQRDTNDPWNTSSSSSGNNHWNQQRETQAYGGQFMGSMGRGSYADASMDSSFTRGLGRGSVLFRSEAGFGRGQSHNDQPMEKDRTRSSHQDRSSTSHHDRSNRHHPWRSERKDKRSPKRR